MWIFLALILSAAGGMIAKGLDMEPTKCPRLKVYYTLKSVSEHQTCSTTIKRCPSGGRFSSGKCYYRTAYRTCRRSRQIKKRVTTTEYVCCPGYIENSNRKCIPEKCSWKMFGDNCDQSCPCREPYYISCQRKSGRCNCFPGRTGLDCSKECDAGFYGKNCRSICSCENNSTCDPIDGKCTCTTLGYTGEKCHLACNGTTYGFDCRSRCQCVWNNTESCDPVHGKCDCRQGYTGSDCSLECDAGFYGKNCRSICSCENNSTCDPIDGKCTCTTLGYTGENCHLACNGTTYGYDCRSRCQCVWNNTESCDPVHGKCDCRQGYTGSDCSLECDKGFYGKNCRFICSCENNSTCDSTDGTCTCTTPGFTGENCHLACNDTTYGYDCQSECQCVWKNTESCDPVHGKCGCRQGYTGSNCSLEEMNDLSVSTSVANNIHFVGILGAVAMAVVILVVVLIYILRRTHARSYACRGTAEQVWHVYEGITRQIDTEDSPYDVIDHYHRIHNRDRTVVKRFPCRIKGDNRTIKDEIYIEVLPDWGNMRDSNTLSDDVDNTYLDVVPDEQKVIANMLSVDGKYSYIDVLPDVENVSDRITSYDDGKYSHVDVLSDVKSISDSNMLLDDVDNTYLDVMLDEEIISNRKMLSKDEKDYYIDVSPEDVLPENINNSNMLSDDGKYKNKTKTDGRTITVSNKLDGKYNYIDEIPDDEKFTDSNILSNDYKYNYEDVVPDDGSITYRNTSSDGGDNFFIDVLPDDKTEITACGDNGHFSVLLDDKNINNNNMLSEWSQRSSRRVTRRINTTLMAICYMKTEQ